MLEFNPLQRPREKRFGGLQVEVPSWHAPMPTARPIVPSRRTLLPTVPTPQPRQQTGFGFKLSPANTSPSIARCDHASSEANIVGGEATSEVPYPIVALYKPNDIHWLTGDAFRSVPQTTDLLSERSDVSRPSFDATSSSLARVFNPVPTAPDSLSHSRCQGQVKKNSARRPRHMEAIEAIVLRLLADDIWRPAQGSHTIIGELR